VTRPRDALAANVAQFRQAILVALESTDQPASSDELAQWLHRKNTDPRKVPGGIAFNNALNGLLSEGLVATVSRPGAFPGQVRIYYAQAAEPTSGA
jgi:hypothetical protein